MNSREKEDINVIMKNAIIAICVMMAIGVLGSREIGGSIASYRLNGTITIAYFQPSIETMKGWETIADKDPVVIRTVTGYSVLAGGEWGTVYRTNWDTSKEVKTLLAALVANE